ncbi:MAG: tetratricopeptide repeat protein, partial [Gammaproteobacteria bacterium]
PAHVDALNMLGVIGCQSGNLAAGRDLLRRALVLDPDHPDCHNNLGMAELGLGEVGAAVAAFAAAVRANPRFAEAWFNLGNAERARGDLDAAERAWRKAVRIRPDYVDAVNNLANLLRQGGRAREAVHLLHKLVRREPGFAPGWLNLGLAFAADGATDDAIAALEQAATLDATLTAEACSAIARCERGRGALTAAEAAYRRALAAAPSAARWNALGAIQFAAGRVDDAATSFAHALELDADAADTHDNLGLVAAARGDRAGAAAHYERALARDPAHGSAWRGLAGLEHAPAETRALVERLEAALAALPEDAPARVPMSFALGHLADRLGEYDRAFDAFSRANRARRAVTRYDGDAQARFIDSLIEVFDERCFVTGAEGASDSERPVFIVGMPRSGTSLVEQVLASHPRVHGAGELTFFPELVQRLPALLGSGQPFPRCLTGARPVLGAVAGDYLAQLAARDVKAAHVTDKMPYNFLYLGLIALLFPRARVVHCRRAAMATCCSIFTHDLAGSHPYAYDLGELARAWAGYERLMAHWRACLPLAMLELDYEALVDDLAGGARRLSAFLELPYDPACLDFHRSPRTVTTASQWQVRRP